ncbi:phage portal protein [Roseiconus lacunae]|uniref:phage portal protein n=1 Tax=Roseiconus lacunae TaxID=2605694 RepID=UPI0030873859|nr:phage portal protein [Stieleria sp. HD01]
MSDLVDPYGKPLISQQRAERRASLRAAYDAASNSSAIAKHFSTATAMSARDTNDPGTRQTLRARSRAECNQNNSFAVGIVRTMVNDIVGRGARLQVTDTRLSEPQRRAIEARNRGWSKASRLTRSVRTGVHAEIVDGEGFLHEATNQRQADDVKLAIAVTEADQITTSITGIDDEHNIDGVHIDDAGYVTHYERLRHHPFDSYSTTAPAGGDDTETIDADQMIHLYRCERPGQYRGVPAMVAALPLFALLRRYTLAVTLCAESAARHHGVIYSDHPSLDGIDPIDAMDEIELELGQFTTMPEGWKIGQLKAEQPVQVYQMFRDAILTEIARCVSMPKNKALGDSGGYNYASGMLDFQTYFAMIGVERDRYEIELYDRVFQWWLDEALLIPGYLPELPALPGGIEHTWIWDEFKHVDPTKVANSTETLWHLGLITDADYLISAGKDPEEHYAKIAAQNKRRAKIGMPLPSGATPIESLDRRAKQAAAEKDEADADKQDAKPGKEAATR